MNLLIIQVVHAKVTWVLLLWSNLNWNLGEYLQGIPKKGIPMNMAKAPKKLSGKQKVGCAFENSGHLLHDDELI